MKKMKEDLLSIGNKEHISDSDIAEGKAKLIADGLGMDKAEQDKVGFDKLSPEELDQLIAQLTMEESTQNKIDNIIEWTELAGGDDFAIEENLSEHLGFKMEEAKSILKERRLNG